MSSDNSPRTPEREPFTPATPATPATPIRVTRVRNLTMRPRRLFFDEAAEAAEAIENVETVAPMEEEKPAVIETIAEKDPNDNNFLCDVVFSFDTTGSMRAALDSVRQNLTDTVDRLFKEVDGIRIGILAHGDYCDYPQMCWKIDLTKDVLALKHFIMQAKNTSGGDPEENYEFVLQQANTFDWKAPAKVFVVIGDEEPHEKGYAMPCLIPGFQSKLHIDWKIETECLRKKGITIFSCHAFPDRANAQCLAFYQYISKVTGGYYFPLSELSMFTDYMVAICLKAADGAETITLLKQRQEQLHKEIEDMKVRNETHSAEFKEKLSDLEEVHTASHHVSMGALFSSPQVAKTASKSRAVLRTKSRVETYAEEMTSKRKYLDSSSQAFLSTISQSEQVEEKHVNIPLFTVDNNENANINIDTNPGSAYRTKVEYRKSKRWTPKE
jgi:hypothetical protein